MKICMVGIDYSTAKVEEREKFSFTAVHAAETAKDIIKKYQVSGCVILSTCNRTEIWYSGLNERTALEIFLLEKGCSTAADAHLFTERSQEEAVTYLMELTCGMHSQIFGEDQILTQVKQALRAGHENQTVDAVLETLFRTAVTCAKKVKSEVRLTKKDQSVPQGAAALLSKQLGELKNKRCVIVGNGEMGHLTAKILSGYGCEIFMTVRSYKYKEAVIPKECISISYEDRGSYICEADIIISATLSPHFTLTKEQLEGKLHREKEYIFVDLAVPRDIDPAIGEIDNVLLYDMDTLGVISASDSKEVEQAYRIIEKHKQEFYDWHFNRMVAPIIASVSTDTGKLTNGKLKGMYKELNLSVQEQKKAEERIQEAAEKAIAQLMYGLKHYMNKEQWKDCILAFEQAVKDSR